jgi:hypothetical protein
MLVRLERHADQTKPCCDNLATIEPGKEPHAAELKCARCSTHRGWLPQQALDFVKTVAAKVGAQEPIILRDDSIGDKALQKFQKKFDDVNKGALFSNKDRKKSETDPDYTGEINVAGVEHRLSGWRKQSKKGVQYLSLSIRVKEEAAQPKPAAVPFNDEIGF